MEKTYDTWTAAMAALIAIGAKWSSSFGNPGEQGYSEYWRAPNGARYEVANGPWHAITPVWTVRRVD